jgi:hypothetical protein
MILILSTVSKTNNLDAQKFFQASIVPFGPKTVLVVGRSP